MGQVRPDLKEKRDPPALEAMLPAPPHPQKGCQTRGGACDPVQAGGGQPWWVGLQVVEGWGCRGVEVLVIGMVTYGISAAEAGP